MEARFYRLIVFLLLILITGIAVFDNVREVKRTKVEESSTIIKNKTTRKDGFHPVYAYYGPESAIDSFQDEASSKNRRVGSQVNQDGIVLSLTEEFRSRATNSEHASYFVDLAANDAVFYSNTYRLEANGWSGLCIEPNQRYWFRLAHRKCDVVGAFVGGDVDSTAVNVTIANKQYGGIVGEDMDNKPSETLKTERRYTVSLRSVFRKFGVPETITYLSLDVEGAEELIMKDFPFDEYKMEILTVERPSAELQKILNENGYTCIAVISNFGESLWIHNDLVESVGLDVIGRIVTAQKVGGPGASDHEVI